VFLMARNSVGERDLHRPCLMEHWPNMVPLGSGEMSPRSGVTRRRTGPVQRRCPPQEKATNAIEPRLFLSRVRSFP